MNTPRTIYVIAGSLKAAERLARHVLQNDMRDVYPDEAALISGWLNMPERARRQNFPYKVRLMRTDDTIITVGLRRLRSVQPDGSVAHTFVAKSA
jgi:hypothetical protein